ncbi:hypothetical protein [Macrococcus armenti]|uniref:Phage gp6-like head-tail connector protein n=1 Tax=Macrococcus armenti TaxID=2875764 RepID=A0ABY3ZRQ6_9STAP|nr:hypothetical protein [Macrococcus armenti]UOB19562.1 hypothetical protein MRZ06_05760 [Macrococcus armenti]
MLEVDKEKIQKFLESDLTLNQIVEYSRIAYSTASIDEASFRTQIKLTFGYKIAFEGYEPEEVNLERRIAIIDAAIGINNYEKLTNESQFFIFIDVFLCDN